MALITCPECGREISDQAQTCPGCGYPIGQKRIGPELGEQMTTEQITAEPAANSATDQAAPADTQNKNASKRPLIGLLSAVAVVALVAVLFLQGFILVGNDKAVFDLVVNCAENFKNPASVRLVSGSYVDGSLFARISAENGFGAHGTDNYMISGRYCFPDDSDRTSDSVYNNRGDFHTGPINNALARKLS